MSSIELKNITKEFDNKKILDDISLVIEDGEMISLLGPSGCGKTTTLKIITGLLMPDEGDIIFSNKSVKDVPVEKREAVIVFQDYLLFPHLNVEENIGFGLKMAKVNKENRRKKVQEMIDLVQLQGQEKKYPKELSGGQKQRVALARALAIEPKVLLLDEPFSNLDMRLRETMREFILEIQKKLKITTILVTHDKEEALMTSQKIAVMLDGKIIQYGTPFELYEKPANPKVADFFGEKNYIEGTIEEGIFHSSLGRFKTNFNRSKNVLAMIKPEEIFLTPFTTEALIKGEIKSRRYAGDRIYYTLCIKNRDFKCLSSSKKSYEVGEAVSVEIDFNNIIYFDNI